MIEQNPHHEELHTNYEALYERPIVDARIEGIDFDNPEDAKTRLVLGREVAPGISMALEIDEDGLPLPSPFGAAAVRAVSMKDGQLDVGKANYGSEGTYFVMSGKRAKSGFSFGGGSPSMGYYEEHSGAFTFGADSQAMKHVTESINAANELYEMTEGKPFEERALGPELTFDAVKQLAIGIAERDYLVDVNSRRSADVLTKVAAEKAVTALNIVKGFEDRPKDLNAPFVEEVKSAVYDQEVWKNLENGRIRHPDIYIAEIQENLKYHGVQGMVREVLTASVKDDVEKVLENHKPDIEAVEAKERAGYAAAQEKYQQQVQAGKDAAAQEVIQRFDGMLPEVVETTPVPRHGLKRKLAAAALAVTTVLGLGATAHELQDDHRTPKTQQEQPAVEGSVPSQEAPTPSQSQTRSFENKTDIVTVDEQTNSVDVELKEGGNPSFAVRDAYRAEGVADPSEQQIHETVAELAVTDAEARSMQPGTTLSFTTQRAEDGSIKLIAKS